MFLTKSNFYLLDTFLVGLFLKPKLNKSFLCFRFDIYFKIYLVVPLGFKVVNVKNSYSKHVFVLSVLQFIWQGLALSCKSFNRRKKYVLIIDEQKQPLKKVFCKNRYSSK